MGKEERERDSVSGEASICSRTVPLTALRTTHASVPLCFGSAASGADVEAMMEGGGKESESHSRATRRPS